MSISFVSPVFGPATLYFNSDRLDPTRPAPTFSRDPGESLKPLLARVVELRRYLETVREDLRRQSTPTQAKSSVLSQSTVSTGSTQNLGLSLAATSATLASTEQVNTLPTSFTPFGPAFNGSSTSLPTIGGVYDGSDGDEVLTFTVKKGGNVGGPYTGKQGAPADLRIEVRRADDSKLDDINFSEATAPGTSFSLRNGLTLSLAAGSLVQNNTFTVNTYTSVPGSVDPDKPLDGTRNNNPNLDPGFQVSPGSFQINGVTINVNSGDSLNALLSKINASAAGVNAVFDIPTETVRLTATTAGASGQITFANDTSGFLAAAKLSGAALVPGTDNDLDRPLSQVAAFAGIQSGDFRINDVTFQVDTATDSLNSLLQSINNSHAGVTAAYVNDRIVVTATTPGAAVTLDNGTSNFFSGSHVPAGTYEPTVTHRSASTSTVDTRLLARRFKEVFDTLGEHMKSLLDPAESETRRTHAGALRASFADAIRLSLKDTLGFNDTTLRHQSLVESGLGLTFAFDDAARYQIHTSESELRSALEKAPDKLLDFLFAEASTGGRQGLLSSLLSSLAASEQDLMVKTGGSTGLLLDAVA